MKLLKLASALLLAIVIIPSCKKDNPSKVEKGDSVVVEIELGSKSATFTCTTSIVAASRCAIEYSTAADLKGSQTVSSMLYGGKATISLSGLTPATTYYYKAIAKTSSQSYANEVRSFTTKESVSGSMGEPANCYIISKAGTYSFPAVKGNSEVSVGSVYSAAVLWSTWNTSEKPSDIITDVKYENGNISFKTAEPFHNGNALIAAKSSTGTILWSWHIWISKDFDPEEKAQLYKGKTHAMMDRNLGALAAAKGDSLAFGLLYQWGRKDPFPGNAGPSQDEAMATTTTLPMAVATSSTVGTAYYATAHPTTFIYGISGERDWLYSADKTLWGSTKTINDPCPAGWRVPDGGTSGVWSAFPRDLTFDEENHGVDFSAYSGVSGTWYPAAGVKLNYSGEYCSSGYSGSWWSCIQDGYRRGYVYSYFTTVGYNTDCSLSKGGSVRCMKE